MSEQLWLWKGAGSCVLIFASGRLMGVLACVRVAVHTRCRYASGHEGRDGADVGKRLRYAVPCRRAD